MRDAAGLLAFRALFASFILRGMRREAGRSIVTVIGIALGVAVVVAVRIANRSAVDSFRAGTTAVAGRATFDVTSATGRFDEMRFLELAWLREYGEVSPVIDGFAWMPSSVPVSPGAIDVEQESGGGEYVQVIGVDMLVDRSLRDWRLASEGDHDEEAARSAARQFFDLLLDGGAAIPRRFAERSGLAVGASIDLLVGDRPVSLRVAAILSDDGPAAGFGGSLAVVDIATAQAVFDRYGEIDRVDVRLADGIALDRVAEVEGRLPAGLRVVRPADRHEQAETMVRSFQFNLGALACLALFVGLFLVYDTASFSVRRRRGEIGRLRAAGASPRLVAALFLGESLVVAIPGTALGCLLGAVTARTAVDATAGTVATFYVAEVARATARDDGLRLAEALVAFAVAVPLALLAAWLPAREASRTVPAEVARGGARPRGLTVRASLTVTCALVGAAGALAKLPAMGDIPVFGYASVVALLLAGTALVPSAIRLVSAGIEGLTRRVSVGRAEALVASRHLAGSTAGLTVSVGALASALAMTLSIAIMISSFRETVADWLHQAMAADIYGRAAGRQHSLAGGVISTSALDLLRGDPEVDFVETAQRLPLAWRGRRITVAAHDFAAYARHEGLDLIAPRDGRAAFVGADPRSSAFISESLSLRGDLGVGDSLELAAALGPRTFTVAGVFRDYSDNQGVVVLDPLAFTAFTASGELDSPSDVAIHLRPGTDAEAVRARLAAALGREHRVVLHTKAGVLERSLEIFDGTFAITWALEAVAITVAGLGIVSTLLGFLLARRRELGILRAAGATPRQLRRVVIFEAGALGLASQLVAMPIGVLLAAVLVFVINVQSFGWTIRFIAAPSLFVWSTVLTLVVTMLAASWPARRAIGLARAGAARSEE